MKSDLPKPMQDPLTSTINIFLKVDSMAMQSYFNEHDPAPLYKRQLSHQLEQYISMGTSSVKRYSVVFYKFQCATEKDKQYAEPLIYALRRHYTSRQKIREKEFKRFKKRNWMLLLFSFLVVLTFQGFLMVLLDENHRVQSGFSNILDVFSWVLLWQPIDKLLFHWNPHLKDISLLRKLATAELIVVENA
jgi:hypothetical protein